MTSITKTEKNTIQEVKAPQAIVHIKHSITLRQYKVWLIVLQKFREFHEDGMKPDDDGLFSFPKSELDNLLDYEINKDVLRSEFEKIRKEPIILNYLEKDKTPATHGMGFISEWKITAKTVKFKLPSFLENVMKGLDQSRAMFALLNWEIFNHFSGKYEAIIYKLCRDFIGAVNTPYMTIEEFRGYMGLKPNEYKEFMDLNKFVIKKPVKSINESAVSDISIKIQYRTEGRKTLGLYFVVSKKNQTSIPFPELEQNPAFQFAKVHIEASMQMEYLALRKPEEIELCIERANEYGEGEAAKGKEPNYGAIYRKAINEGWHTSYADKKAKKEAVEAKKRKEIEQEQDAAQKKAAEAAKTDSWLRDTLAAFAALPEERKTELRGIYASGLADITRKSFDKQAENAPMHRMKFAKFAEQYLNK
jgi:plasmid replication initiation protein